MDHTSYTLLRGGGKAEETAALTAVMMREGMLQRLQQGLLQGEDCVGTSRVAVQLAIASVRVVEAVEKWRRSTPEPQSAGRSSPGGQRRDRKEPFTWSGVNYLLKMAYDMPTLPGAHACPCVRMNRGTDTSMPRLLCWVGARAVVG